MSGKKVARSSRGRLSPIDFLFHYEFTVHFLIFVSLILIFAILSPGHYFISPKNIQDFLALAPEFSIIVLGVGMLMICGEFDLSIGSIIAFDAYIMVRLFEITGNLFLAGFAALGVGVLLGLLNGLITVKGKIPSFITTLGTMMLWRGLVYLLTGGYSIPFTPETSPSFSNIFVGEIGPVPVQIVWFTIFGLILLMLLHLHKFGNWVFATGNNKEGARAMGINTDMTKIICFAIVGLLSAFVAITISVHHRTFYALMGQFYELKAIAASVVGGTSLFGGIGSMPGIILGALIIPLIENGLILLRIEYYWVYIFYGLIIISFTILSRYMEKKRLEEI